MDLPPPPPIADVLEKLHGLVLPAAGGAGLVSALVLALSRRLGFLAAAAGCVAGLAVANWRPAQPAPAAEATEDTDAPAEPPPVAPSTVLGPWWPAAGARAWEWVGPLAGVLALVGVISHYAAKPIANRSLAVFVTWLPRAAGVAAVAWLVRPGADPPRPWWVAGLFGLVVLAQWVLLEVVGRGSRNRSAQVVMLQAAALWLAAGLCLYAHSGLLCDVVTAAGAAVFGVAVVGFATGADVRGAVPVGAVLLTVVVFLAHETTSNAIPPAGYWLAATAPFGLAAWLVPALHRRDGWVGWALRWAVVVGLAAAALVVAGRVETLPWEGEQW